MFRLGARHIAEGTDHLLFLLALILPAPLVAANGRWGGYAGWKTAFRRIVKVVTAFTLGHSITLVFGALGWVRLPGALVESAIALSILVSAVHALVPVFRGREVFIAGGFGLVHGLAFAATLTGFGFDPLTMVSSVLGFNLGIEAVQLLVILAAMPWLVLLAPSRVYGPFRITGAALTGIAAAAWLAERTFGWANPIVPARRKCRLSRPLAPRGPRRPDLRRDRRGKPTHCTPATCRQHPMNLSNACRPFSYTAHERTTRCLPTSRSFTTWPTAWRR